jgi:hypothetical protein
MSKELSKYEQLYKHMTFPRVCKTCLIEKDKECYNTRYTTNCKVCILKSPQLTRAFVCGKTKSPFLAGSAYNESKRSKKVSESSEESVEESPEESSEETKESPKVSEECKKCKVCNHKRLSSAFPNLDDNTCIVCVTHRDYIRSLVLPVEQTSDDLYKTSDDLYKKLSDLKDLYKPI